MEVLLTDEECKAIIKSVAIKLCARAQLIATRLLTEEDKNDMRQGNLSIEVLEDHIKVWIENGMPDYAHGKHETYAEEQRRAKFHPQFKKEDPQSLKYHKAFVDPSLRD